MALPKRRHSRSRTRKRRSHDALSAPGINVCAECGEPKMPHRVCPNCGMYKGRSVYSMDTEIE